MIMIDGCPNRACCQVPKDPDLGVDADRVWREEQQKINEAEELNEEELAEKDELLKQVPHRPRTPHR